MRRLRAGAGVFPWSAKKHGTPICTVGQSPSTFASPPDREESSELPLSLITIRWKVLENYRSMFFTGVTSTTGPFPSEPTQPSSEQ